MPYNNELTLNPLEQANLFNKYFSSVFTVDIASNPVIQPRTVDNIRFDCVIFNVDYVHKAYHLWNRAPPTALTVCPTSCWRNLLTQSVILSAISLIPVSNLIVFLHSGDKHIIYVFKKGTTSDPSNYRPMSLTCTCSCRRVMERIINRPIQLIDYLFSNNLITKHQHGFLLKHSTCTNLLETINDWFLHWIVLKAMLYIHRLSQSFSQKLIPNFLPN